MMCGKRNILLNILSLPKSLWVNLKYLPIKQAIRLPICISYRVRIKCKGSIKIKAGKIRQAMIRIGFHQVPVCDGSDQTLLIIEKGGVLIFCGDAHIGNGSKLHVAPSASLKLGDNFAISASSAINCYKKITFGRDIQFSWNCLVMDSDTHQILDINGKCINEDRPIRFGDKIWVGCNTTVLKGADIPSNCVIGANSVVCGRVFEENSIIIGNPAKCSKKIGCWQL